ncbi:acetyltransferase [Lactobacillus salivarius]|uniref:Acetyltransferase n=2 Tax=Ligilactobacillus salivarius TaxID=1624 RepID=A0ABD6J9E8_9LACO|nr:acetyltransferase [Ligilactobacillus salivarius]ADJ79367.1 Acetyltransferase [Ligilactobacillus salivarius CECT 5713]MBM6708108.1 acetyltransferase [Ligilactobacillus salivarius]MDE1499137.1 acetyltransferase [Ligilactobacillus salivarius]MDE1501063.1 acetyltransferase [Ligilactobacillus salivarius]MDE1524226.1 acetyltransferase [Ligilactobacillus salivarius]
MKNFDIEKIKKITNQGNLYYDFDEDIDNARNYAFTNCRKYNSDYQIKGEADRNLILDLLGSYGENFVFKVGFICEFGFNFHVENNVSIGKGFKLIDCNDVFLGNNVQIGNNVGIFTSKHAENPQYRADHWVKDLPITIGNNVVIEDDVVIGGGVTIGDNVVVERNSVVIKDVPSNSFVTGNPPCIKLLK